MESKKLGKYLRKKCQFLFILHIYTFKLLITYFCICFLHLTRKKSHLSIDLKLLFPGLPDISFRQQRERRERKSWRKRRRVPPSVENGVGAIEQWHTGCPKNHVFFFLNYDIYISSTKNDVYISYFIRYGGVGSQNLDKLNFGNKRSYKLK